MLLDDVLDVLDVGVELDEAPLDLLVDGVREARDGLVQHLARRLVDPVQVLDDHHHGTRACEGPDEPLRGGEHVAPAIGPEPSELAARSAMMW